jgi:protein-S-isoprenylcysteine O-methyltransferase Ste14
MARVQEPTMQKSGAQDSLVLSYLGLRRAVGIIGFALPFVLSLGKIVFGGGGIEPSISHYYYTNMGDVFVGSLCAIGVFLTSTRGYSEPKFATTSVGQDHFFGVLAGIFSVGTALIPTDLNEADSLAKLTLQGGVHLALAASLFLTLAYFCLKLFIKTGGNPTKRKLQRNLVYRISGYTILACLMLIVIAALPRIEPSVRSLNPRFWLESLAVLAFGFAWLTKGETILKDEETQAGQAGSAVVGKR